MLRKLLILTSLLLMMGPGMARAAEEKPIQLSVFNPVQMVPAEESIGGLRLNLLYTVNKDVTGLSLSFPGVNRTTGDVKGIELGLGNWTEGSFYGWQAGWINSTAGRFVGLQSGLVNLSKGEFTGAALGVVNYADASVKGFQWGLVNYAGEMHGFQLGFVNGTRSLDGLQIGLGNYNGNKEPFEFLPIVNWKF